VPVATVTETCITAGQNTRQSSRSGRAATAETDSPNSHLGADVVRAAVAVFRTPERRSPLPHRLPGVGCADVAVRAAKCVTPSG